MKKNINKSGNLIQESRQVTVAHFEAKGMLYLWFFSFLFLLLIIILGFVYLQYQISTLA